MGIPSHFFSVPTIQLYVNTYTFQRRLVESHGLQCGFCTPGFVMSVFTLIRNNPTPTRDELEKAIEGKGMDNLIYHWRSSHYALTHVRNKNNNIQGRLLNVVK